MSVVVVSVGALSATSMQLLSKRNNWEATQRLLATHLANTLAERLRADNAPETLAAYVSVASTNVGMERVKDALGIDCTEDDPVCCPEEGNAASCCLEEDDACTPEQIARVVLWQWEQMLDGNMEQSEFGSAGGLDRPTACVTSEGTPGTAGFYSVTIAFRGTLALPDNAAIACGKEAADALGTRLYGEDDEYRRTLTVPAYIKPTVTK